MDPIGFRQFLWYIGYLIDNPSTFVSYALTCKLCRQYARELTPMKKNEYAKLVNKKAPTYWKVLPNGMAHYINDWAVVNTGKTVMVQHYDGHSIYFGGLPFPNVCFLLKSRFALRSVGGIWWLRNIGLRAPELTGFFCIRCKTCHSFDLTLTNRVFTMVLNCKGQWIQCGRYRVNMKLREAIITYAKSLRQEKRRKSEHKSNDV